MLAARFTELVGCSTPIQQAGMGAVASPELAAAVSEAGGVGMLGMSRPGGGTLQRLQSLLDGVTTLRSRPFGINFIATPTNLADVEPGCFELAARSARVVEFFYGWPDHALVDLVHHRGALVTWQVGSHEDGAGCNRRRMRPRGG